MNHSSSKINDLNSMDISLKEIMYFITVVENGSITKAAQKLFIAQPYLTKVIQGIENRIDVQLFERKGKSLYLTQAETVFYHQMYQALGTFSEGISLTKNTGNMSETVLNTAVSYDLDPVKLTSHIHSLQELMKCSNIQCRNFYDILSGIDMGLLDCAVIFRDYVGFFPECHSIEIGKIQTKAIVSDMHLFALQETIHSSDLHNERICFYIESNIENKLLQSSLTNYCKEINVDPGEAHIADNYLSALYYVTRENAVVIGNEYSLIPNNSRIVSIPIADNYQTLFLIYSKKLPQYKADIIRNILYSENG